MTQVHIQKLHSLTGHRDGIFCLHPSGTDSLFFSGAGDGMVVCWDLENPGNGDLIAKLPNSIYALLLMEKQGVLVAGHNYEGIHLLDWQNKKELASLKLTQAAIFDIQSFEDAVLVATGDGVIYKVDLKTLTILKKVQGSVKSARSVSVNYFTGEIAVGFSDNFIRVFDQNLTLKYAWEAHQNSVFTVRYSPDSQFLLSGSRDARLKVWDVMAEYRLVEEVVAHLYAINHVEFSPDGKHFVTCSMDKTIKVWDANAYRLLKVIDKGRHAGHATSVNKLLWTKHKNQLLSASDDRSISVWQIIF
ncbi:MAG: WD40 repeat domain-containing protein [Cyclobacteriaceae bacterium]